MLEQSTGSKYLRRGGGVSGVALLAACLTSFPASADVKVSPRIELEEIYTDNVFLVETNKTAEVVSVVKPGVRIEVNGKRINLVADYTAKYFYFPGENKDDLRHDLVATLNTEVIRNFFFIDANARIDQQFFDRGGSSSFSEANISDNRNTVQRYSVSPYFRGRLEELADWEVRYQLGYLNTDGDSEIGPLTTFLSDSVTHRASARINSGAAFRSLRWSVLGIFNRTERDGPAQDFENESVRATLGYRLNRQVAVSGSVGYESTNLTNIVGDDEGVVWDVGVDLNPGPKTAISARYGRRLRNDVFTASLSYRMTEHTILVASFTDQFQTSQGLLASQLDQATIGDDGIARDVNGFPVEFGGLGFSLTDRNFRRKSLRSGITVNRRKLQVTLTGNYEQREFDTAPVTKNSSYGANAQVVYRPAARLAIFWAAGYRNFGFSGATSNEDFYFASSRLDYRLTRRISTYAQYAFSKRKSDLVGNSLEENAVTIGLRVNF